MFFLIRIDSQIQATETTTTMLTTTTTIEVPEPKYRRLDMAKLPPYRLEQLSQQERNEKYLVLDLFSPIQYKNIWDDETEAKRAEEKHKADLARPVTRMTQTKSKKNAAPILYVLLSTPPPSQRLQDALHKKRTGVRFKNHLPGFASTTVCAMR